MIAIVDRINPTVAPEYHIFRSVGIVNSLLALAQSATLNKTHFLQLFGGINKSRCMDKSRYFNVWPLYY